MPAAVAATPQNDVAGEAAPSTRESRVPADNVAPTQPDPGARYRLIREAAYSLYAQRGYQEGYHLEDWLQAEAQVDEMLGADQGSDQGSGKEAA
jgi:Protein of unknown function (DUF2934)